MKKSKKTRFLAIDLCCGCGGLSLGLKRAGFDILAAVDNDALSVETYRMNHRTTHVVEDDIRSIDPAALMKDLNLNRGELDLLAGCPPCQGFSTLRTFNGNRQVDEEMNDLIFEFVRFTRVFLPKALMIENVPALLQDDRLKKVRREFEALGYRCNADVFDAEEYGVPQRRLRMIFFAFRGCCPAFGSPSRKRSNVAEAIRRLPSPEVSKDPAHNYRVRRSKRVKMLISLIPKNGGSRKDLPDEYQLECHKRFKGFHDVYGRMSWRKPAPTITGGCINPSKGRFLHPEEDRSITLREAALLQGFPKSYRFTMERGRHPVAQLIGNAFPPEFAERHAKSIRRHLEKHTRTDM